MLPLVHQRYFAGVMKPMLPGYSDRPKSVDFSWVADYIGHVFIIRPGLKDMLEIYAVPPGGREHRLNRNSGFDRNRNVCLIYPEPIYKLHHRQNFLYIEAKQF